MKNSLFEDHDAIGLSPQVSWASAMPELAAELSRPFLLPESEKSNTTQSSSFP